MSKEIKEFVKESYTKVLTSKSQSCCGPSCCTPSSLTTNNFSKDYTQLEGYVEGADYGLGCGIPTEHAKLEKGQTVLDLGSGAGNDVFVAQQIVGKEGFVIGVDMTEAMITKSNENKAKLGFENIDFRLGEIEDLPVENDSVDVVISNCVMNLVPSKLKAYQEVYRVLKTGGHFTISDIVVQGELPEHLRNTMALYAGCVGGAVEQAAYIQAIKDAGFPNVDIVDQHEVRVADELLLEHISKEDLANLKASGTKIISITVVGQK
ncbi:MAG: arsenite methyltransferase [Aureispira sp.]|nr:arsenite methyltransferase [Aureispira sp.]